MAEHPRSLEPVCRVLDITDAVALPRHLLTGKHSNALATDGNKAAAAYLTDDASLSDDEFRPPTLGKIKTKSQGAEDIELQYSGSSPTPLLATAFEDNCWACGNNSCGQLGVETFGNIVDPLPIQDVRRWAMVSLGEQHGAGVSCDGELYTWGAARKGQLGHGDLEPCSAPTKVDLGCCAADGAFAEVEDVRGVACGAEHTVAVTGRHVYAWGSNEFGQLGIDVAACECSSKPMLLRTLCNVAVTHVVCGTHHTLALTAQSVVYTWGSNCFGQLGLDDRKDRRVPTVVDALWALPVKQLAAGNAHSAVLTTSGFMFSWGDNRSGQLGLPPNAERAAEVRKSKSSRSKMRKRVDQRYLSIMLDMGIPCEKAELALYETGNMGVELATEWLFGSSEREIVQHLEEWADSPTVADKAGDTAALDLVLAPRRVPLKGVKFIAAGGCHTVAITQEGVYSWGGNTSGQLGLGTANEMHVPARVCSLDGKNIHAAACGSRHTLFLSKDGGVYACGAASHGQIGGCDRAHMGGAAKLVLQPSLMRLPFVPPSHNDGCPVVCAVVAGAHGSAFLTRAADDPIERPSLNLWSRLQETLDAAERDVAESGQQAANRHLSAVKQAVESIFGSAAAITAAFGAPAAAALDYELLDSMLSRVLLLYDSKDSSSSGSSVASTCYMNYNSIQQALHRSALNLLDELAHHVKLLGTPERAQLLLAASQHPLLSEHKLAKSMLPRLCQTILEAPSAAHKLLIKWWQDYPPELLEKRVVKPLQSYLTEELKVTKKLTVSVMNAIKVLAKVEEANQISRRLPPEAFYNQLISEKMDVLDHYVAWRQTQDQPKERRSTSGGPFSFCSYPFLLDAKAKSRLLHTEARIQMEQTVAQARMENMYMQKPRRSTKGDYDQESILPSKKSKQADAVDRSGRGKSPRDMRERKRTSDGGGGLRRFVLGRWFTSTRGDSGASTSSAAASTSNAASPPHASASPSTAELGTSFAATNTHRYWKGSDDERRMVAREASGGGLFPRTHSMNLPPPEQCNVQSTHPDMCILRVRRHHLVEDALEEIARQKPKDLFKPLRVHFIGEDGIDAGGVKKEFFALLLQELLSPDYGMLQFQPESRTYWFHAASKDMHEDWMLVGLVVGLAMYNAVLLDFPLPMALYKKLHACIRGDECSATSSCTLRELKEMQPDVGRSLEALLQYNGEEDVADVFCQTFSLEQEVYGGVQTVELRQYGENTFVTADNRWEFVDAYVDYVLNISVKRQFEAFKQGFMQLFGGPAITLFNAQELERLVCGNPNLDFEALIGNARYEGGFTADSGAVKWLWEVVRAFTLDEKKMFLKFFTGSDRAPIGGLGNLKCIIQRDGTDGHKLPTSHTCFNTLLLPDYKSRDVLCDRLKLAIMNSEGFGLE